MNVNVDTQVDKNIDTNENSDIDADTNTNINVSPTVIKDLGIYIHIPFCVKKCDYCDFLSAPATDELKKEYLSALLIEIESYRDIMKDYVVPTIFIGGGTPSCLEAEDIQIILETICYVFCINTEHLEVTIEVNPGTINRDKLLIYQRAGINRLSFGLQSVNNEELKLLGRIHSYEQFKENYLLAREIGFTNINIDLMSALPGQTLSSWENTLSTVIELNPEHISAYSLIVEEGTKFFEVYSEGKEGYLTLPDEDTDRLIYQSTKTILESQGYHRYEISNYAKRGFECKHNSSYWIGTEYLGLGLGASSLLNGARFNKTHDIKQYIQSSQLYKNDKSSKTSKSWEIDDKSPEIYDPIGLNENLEILTKNQRMEEYMFLGLRMSDGISKNAFYQRFLTDIDFVFGEVFKKLSDSKVIKINGDNIQLTDYGIDISNSVFVNFLINLAQ